MSSRPIRPLVETLASDDAAPADLTDRDRHSLLTALGAVPDPRDPRGIRYPLASLPFACGSRPWRVGRGRLR